MYVFLVSHMHRAQCARFMQSTRINSFFDAHNIHVQVVYIHIVQFVQRTYMRDESLSMYASQFFFFSFVSFGQFEYSFRAVVAVTDAAAH